jgi:glyoxylate/hydroxypyruvate reductase A
MSTAPATEAPVVLVAAPGAEGWRAAIADAAAEAGVALDLRAGDDPVPADRVRYVVFAPGGPAPDFAAFPALRAILSLWAGVEKLLALPLPGHVPLCRMVEPGLREGMRDYVVGHVMRWHLDLDAAIAGPGPRWGAPVPPLARERTVGVLGLGEMGGTAAAALAGLGFRVLGWSRTPRALPGVDCRSGADGLRAVLGASGMVVALLPRTPATENLLDAAAFAAMRPGAALINAGRGEAVDDAALLAALDAGRLSRATLDVFRAEPLPADHPFRRHPRVTVTPHVAAATRPATAAAEIVAQIRRAEAGSPLLHVVERTRGY